MKSPARTPRSPRSPRGNDLSAIVEFDGDGRPAGPPRRLADLLTSDGAGAAAAPARTSGKRHAKSKTRAPSGGGGVAAALAAAFLPEGYPSSVTPDYGEFVVWNAIQGLSSYVRGVLSSHAVLRGVGVGDGAATALGAVFQFFVRDVVGMAGGIAFAAAGDFQAYAKQWRLFADVANDVAMATDLASPLFPHLFLALACFGSLARATVGVAAGATHAALTQHFAARGGGGGSGSGSGGAAAADLTAKADSRERAASIVGSVIGMGVTRVVADHALAAWTVFALLTALHVYANVRAMRCLVLTTLNVPRLELLLDGFVGGNGGRVPTPAAVSRTETLLAPPVRAVCDFASGGWWRGRSSARIVFGERPADVLRALAGPGAGSAAAAAAAAALRSQAAAAAGEYVVALDCRHGTAPAVLVALARGAGDAARLRAYLHALHLARGATAAAADTAVGAGVDDADAATLLARSETWMRDGRRGCGALLEAAERAGWSLAGASLPRPAWTGKWC